MCRKAGLGGAEAARVLGTSAMHGESTCHHGCVRIVTTVTSTERAGEYTVMLPSYRTIARSIRPVVLEQLAVKATQVTVRPKWGQALKVRSVVWHL